MAVGNANVAYLGIADEVVWGTSAARQKYLEFNSEDIRVTEEKLISPSLYRAGIHKDRSVQGGIALAGSFSFNPHYEGMLKLIRAALHGTPTTTTPDPTNASTVRQHVFTVADALSAYSLTLEVNRDIGVFIATGCKIAQMSFDFPANDLAQFTCQIIGKDITTGSGLTPVFSSAPLIRASDTALTWGGTSLNIANVSIQINNGLGAERRFIGSRYIAEPVREDKLSVSGSFTAEFESLTQYTDFRDATRRQLIVTATGATIAASQAYLFKMQCDVGEIQDYNPVVDDQGRITVDVDFRAYRDNSSNELQITVKNTETAV